MEYTEKEISENKLIFFPIIFSSARIVKIKNFSSPILEAYLFHYILNDPKKKCLNWLGRNAVKPLFLSVLQWADTHFPFCHHGKRCLMRTVLKIGPNNGRNFYTCSFQKGKQCDFFQWAENGPGVSILPGC